MVKIELNNFQAHEKTELTIPVGLSCIVGPSNCGKSSIVRAIRWLFYDSFRGSKFIRKGKTKAQVTISFPDKQPIIRTKGKGENSFAIGEAKYASIGTGVPQEVSKELSIHPIFVDKDLDVEIHVSNQLDHPFLVFETPSVRAKFMNVLTGGNYIDMAVRETKRLAGEADRKKETLEAEAERVKTEMAGFDGLAERKVILDSIAGQLDELDRLETSLKDMLSIRDAVEHNQIALMPLQKQSDAVDAITDSEIKEGLDLLERLTNLEMVEMQIGEVKAKEALTSDMVDAAEAEHRKHVDEFKALPDFECDKCGQVVTRTVREKQLEAVR